MTALVPVVIICVMYAAGVTHVWRSAGVGHGISKRSVSAFALAIISLLVALLPPLDTYADELQSAHMIQHLILILIAPALLLSSDMHRAAAWSLPHYYRIGVVGRIARSRSIRRGAAFLTSPRTAFSLHAVTLIVWHLPGPYEAAAGNEIVHALEHVSFLLTAMLFWWALLAPAPFRKLSDALAIPYVVGMSFIGSLVGAVLTFASTPLYDSYLATAPLAGLSALEDQQLAGLIMWIPGGIAYLIFAAALFVRWMNRANDDDHPEPLGALGTG
jgi:putative membrane protein